MTEPSETPRYTVIRRLEKDEHGWSLSTVHPADAPIPDGWEQVYGRDGAPLVWKSEYEPPR